MFSRINQFMEVRRRRRRIVPGPWRRRPWTMATLLVIAAAVLIGRRFTAPTSGDDFARYHRKVFTVAKVVDGDTVDLDVPDDRHAHTRVRLWGVDTPEVAASGRGEMYYGPEASAYAKAALDGREVTVTLVQNKTRDRYGRLLAYLTLPDSEKTFNERLIETGHGYADWRYGHPYKEKFLATERQARKSRQGLWAHVRADQMPPWAARKDEGGRQKAEGKRANDE
jgi:micrococcal nuclease